MTAGLFLLTIVPYCTPSYAQLAFIHLLSIDAQRLSGADIILSDPRTSFHIVNDHNFPLKLNQLKKMQSLTFSEPNSLKIKSFTSDIILTFMKNKKNIWERKTDDYQVDFNL